LIAKSLSEERQ